MSPIYLERNTHRLKTTRHTVLTTDVRALRRQKRVAAGWAARGVQGGAASTGRAAAALVARLAVHAAAKAEAAEAAETA